MQWKIGDKVYIRPKFPKDRPENERPGYRQYREEVLEIFPYDDLPDVTRRIYGLRPGECLYRTELAGVSFLWHAESLEAVG